MPIFQFTDDDGETHHFEAPNEESASKVLALLQGGPQEESEGDHSANRRVSSSFEPSSTQPQTGYGDSEGDESSLSGVGKAFGMGLANGAVKLAGMPGDVIGAGRQLLGDQSQQPTFLGADHLRQLIESQTGPFYQPKGRLEAQAEAIGEAVPGAAINPHGSAVRTLARVAVPAIANHVAHQVFKNTPLETPARVVGDVLRAGSDVLGASNMDLQRAIKSALLSKLWTGVTGLNARGQSQ